MKMITEKLYSEINSGEKQLRIYSPDRDKEVEIEINDERVYFKKQQIEELIDVLNDLMKQDSIDNNLEDWI
jgi:hypothetical protein